MEGKPCSKLGDTRTLCPHFTSTTTRDFLPSLVSENELHPQYHIYHMLYERVLIYFAANTSSLDKIYERLHQLNIIFHPILATGLQEKNRQALPIPSERRKTIHLLESSQITCSTEFFAELSPLEITFQRTERIPKMKSLKYKY